MNLTEYLALSGTSRTAFASEAGIAQTTIWRLVSLGVIPQRATVEKIVSATGGKVSEADLVAEALAARVGQRPEGSAA